MRCISPSGGGIFFYWKDFIQWQDGWDGELMQLLGGSGGGDWEADEARMLDMAGIY